MRLPKKHKISFIISILLTIISPAIAFLVNSFVLILIYGNSDSGNTDMAFGLISLYFMPLTIFVIISIIWITWLISYLRFLKKFK